MTGMKPLLLAWILACALPGQDAHPVRQVLDGTWFLQSSSQVPQAGAAVSVPGFGTKGWHPARVPTTVLNALVKNGVYPDPRVGLNNFRIPDISDAANATHGLAAFSHLPGKRNPWQDPTWFRTEFRLPPSGPGQRQWLDLDSVNYRADVWLNGHLVAGARDVVGMFRRFRFDVTGCARPGAVNALAVLVHPVDHYGNPLPGRIAQVFGPPRGADPELFKDETLKLSGGYDCAPVVRDRNTGLCQAVAVRSTGPVVIEEPWVVTDLPLPDTSRADLTLRATLVNTSDTPRTVTLEGTIALLTRFEFPTWTRTFDARMEPIRFQRTFHLAPHATTQVRLAPADLPQLTVRQPHLWWPNGYGEPYLHTLDLVCRTPEGVSDRARTTFGIRTVSSTVKELQGSHGRIFLVNGRRVFCRGGWIQPEAWLDTDLRRVYDEARLLAEANLNVLGNEDAPAPSEAVMDSYDKFGLMAWETFQQCFRMNPTDPATAGNPLDHALALADTRDIIQRYRNHPSLVAWCAANETTPCEAIYMPMRQAVRELDGTRPFLASTNIDWDVDRFTPYLKPDLPLGVTDKGHPGYCWHPADDYFRTILEVKDQMFRDELGVPSVPVYSSLKKFIPGLGQGDPSAPYYPLDAVWAEHDAWDGDGYAFRAYDRWIREAYGRPASAWDYARKAQFVNADSYRAMFEAANHRMWDITSGVMLWKLNACWPSLVWQIYDAYQNPNAAYYATKKACEPVHTQMNAHDRTLAVINATPIERPGLTLTARVLDLDLKVRWEQRIQVQAGSDRCQEVGKVPEIPGITPVHFVQLELRDAAGAVVSSNFYWLSSSPKPDFRALEALAQVDPEVQARLERREGEFVAEVTVRNATDRLVLLKRLVVTRGPGGEEIAPVFWSDNYLTLLPGETRRIRASFAAADAAGKEPVVGVERP
jgi:hypothetical protein